ncbi:MAG TPA: hypothetical protein VK152_00290 [Paludibacter sp.]|nr:hypothetical protein [Paludibacter sp.]
MSDYIKVNVNKATGPQPGAGLQVKEAITLIDVEGILSMGARDGKGVVITDPFVMKDSEYAITIYATQDSVELDSNSDGDTDNEGFTPSIKFKHPGNKQAVREFKSNWIGRKCIVVVDHCDGSGKDLIGSLCNPCKMKVSLKGNKDATSNEFTFDQMMRGNDVAIFDGTVPYAEPKAVIGTGLTEIALQGEGEYQLTGGSAALATVTGASHGLLFTLLGATSGVAPTLAASSSFILKDGTSWTGGPGKQITLKCYKTGASSYVYIEQSRV